MLSSGLIFIILTPCVCRPKDGISAKDTRMTWPFKEIAMSSSSPCPIILATISGPVFSVTCESLDARTASFLEAIIFHARFFAIAFAAHIQEELVFPAASHRVGSHQFVFFGQPHSPALRPPPAPLLEHRTL